MTDLRALVGRFKELPELAGASLVAASPDLLVLVPGAQQSFTQIKQTLLQQPEVYELDVGDESYRREGDKPYDQLRKEKLGEVLTMTKGRIQERIREKLRELVRGKRKRADGAAAAAAGGEGAVGASQEAEAETKAAQRAARRAAGKKRGARRGKRRAAKRGRRGDAEGEEL